MGAGIAVRDESETGNRHAAAPANRRSRATTALARVALVAFGMVLFAIHASAYRDWLIDDSGISFAYARHLAAGQGLVSQPGLQPVEGYSNPLWVFLLAGLSGAGSLALPLGPKLISAALVAGTYAMLVVMIERMARRPRLVGAVVLLSCSLNPSFVIWCTSGLENALYACLIVGLACLTTESVSRRAPDLRGAFAACGVVAALVAMTRPDGALYALVPPLVAVVTGKRDRRALLAYAAGLAAPLGAFLSMRLAIFHRIVPTTVIAKGGPRASDVLGFLLLSPGGIEKLMRLLEACFAGLLANVVFLGGLAAARFLAVRGRLPIALGVALAFSFAALADFMLIPADWMRENRFGTAFFPLYYAVLFALVDVVLESTPVRRKSVAFAAVTATLLSVSFPDFAGRALAFARAPDINLFFVRRAFAERFDRYTDTLRLEHASALLPDVGGMLLWSNLRVFDLAGLCDPRMARMRSHEPAAERDYVFAGLRPTFIHTYGIWSRTASFEQDPRLSSDYAAIHEYSQSEDPEGYGHASGIYVRREALVAAGGEGALEPLRRERHRRESLLEPPRATGIVLWLENASFVPEEYRASEPMISREKAASIAH